MDWRAHFPAIKDVPNWNDWSVRLAGAYDLFGTGKTALKLNAGKYIASQAAGFAPTSTAMTYSTQTARLARADRNDRSSMPTATSSSTR